MNGYHHGVVSGKSVIGGTALTLSQAIARCSSLTDILFGDTELLTSAGNNSCESDDCDDNDEVTLTETVNMLRTFVNMP